MTFTIKNPNAAKEEAIRRARQKPEQSSEAPIIKFVKVEDCKDKLRVFFDDSGSMYAEIENAKKGVVEFLRNCIPNQTAVAIHFLNTVDEELSCMSTNLPALGQALTEKHLSSGGTPLFTCMNKGVEEKNLTRMIVFTDGEPSDSLLDQSEFSHPHKDNLKSADIIIAKALERKIPIDTVFFGSTHGSDATTLLKYFAEKTGGYFLYFDPAKVNFRTAFKYLAPVNRLALASESVRREIESGTRN